MLASNVDAAASFCRKLIGYQVDTMKRRGGEHVMLLSDGLVRAGIMQNPMEKWQPEWLTYFAVTDLTIAAARVESLGGKVLVAPSPDVREGTLALIADPSGAVLALQKWPL